jgi:ATP-binding cassette subfamily B protein
MKFSEKIQIFFNDIKKVSKLTKTKNKKIKILISAVLSNLIVLMDILIILSFTYIFTKDSSIYNSITKPILDNLELLPFLIIIRFSSIYLDKLNIQSLSYSIEENLRKNLVNEIFDKGNYSSSDAYFYLNTISTQVASFYSTLAIFIGSGLQIVAYLVYLIVSDIRTIAVLSTIIILLYFPTIFLVKLGRKYAHKTYLSSQSVSSDIENVVDNLFLIKILNLTKQELGGFYKNLEEYYKSSITNYKLGTLNAIMPNFLTMFSFSIIAAYTVFVKYLTLDFIGVCIRLFQSLGILNNNLHLVTAYHVYLEKLYQLEDNKDIITKENYQLSSNKKNNLSIQIEDVTFKYFNSELPIFEKLNFELKRGEHLIITGQNGSGKSTLMGLIAGIFYPESGKIKVNCSKLGYVGTKPLILNGTIKENLSYGCDQTPSDNEMVQLLEKFKVFNEESKINLNMVVSNRSLSSGQMQKISFIRAFLNKSEILLLDEAFSNIDKTSKETISEILRNENLTIINSTHKSTDFKNITKHIEIVVVDNKRYIKSLI